MRTVRITLWFLLAWLITAPAFAYTIYLKDGSRIITQKKYEVVDGQAILLLQNGTQASYDLDRIDVPRTEKANSDGNYGSAIIFEDGKAVEKPTAPPPQGPNSLSDLIKSRNAGLRGETGSQRDGVITDSGEAAANRADPGRVTDGPSAEPSAMRAELAGELRQYFRSRGLDEVAVFRGSGDGSALVQVSTASESSVFRAIAVGAKALQDIGERPDVGLQNLELAMTTPSGENAGRMRITPAMAQELISKQTEVTDFFVRYVQFE